MGLYRVEQVGVYKVKGYLILAKSRNNLEEYLKEVREYGDIEYLYDKYIILVGKEKKDFRCKEMEHLKINELYDTENIAMIMADFMETDIKGVG